MQLKRDKHYHPQCPECEESLKCNIVLEFYSQEVKLKNGNFEADIPTDVGDLDKNLRASGYIAQVYCPHCGTCVAHEAEINEFL
jgi:endogenous inhibitor of DNA gyrase (YacG/DUF329 family)